ncbi:MAG: hypothetical protein R6X34_21240 [Chloroflexota bacterium]
MTNLSLNLICGLCSHDWLQDLSEIDTFKVIEQDQQFTKIYRIPCPICGHVLMVETTAGSDDIPTSWGT